MQFTKMHGLGNDYIYVDAARGKFADPPRAARLLSDRHKGIGGDGLIIIHPPSGAGAVCRMEMYNADGSRSEMCGNGIRCVAKYAIDRGWTAGPGLSIETDAGLRNLRVVGRGSDGKAELIEVDMGAPRWRLSEVPVDLGGATDGPALEIPLEVLGRRITATGVSMGNPHCVIRISGNAPFGSSLGGLDLPRIGPALENHPAFPKRTNVEFVEPRSPREIDFRVWERGSGETLACGTGACAAVVAGVLGGFCERSARVHLLGGDLDIRWDEATGRVFMTGPACEVFTGELSDRWLEAVDRSP